MLKLRTQFCIFFTALALSFILPNSLAWAQKISDYESIDTIVKENAKETGETSDIQLRNVAPADGSVWNWWTRTTYNTVGAIGAVVGWVNPWGHYDESFEEWRKNAARYDLAISNGMSLEEVDAHLKSQNAFKEIYVDATGKNWAVEKNGEGKIINATYASDKAYKGCEVLPVKLYNQKQCFFCPLFRVIYRAADNMATISMTNLATSFATLIALGLGIWIAFQTLTHVSSLTKQDAPKFLGNLVKQSFKFLIAFLLLHYTSEIYLWVVRPLLMAGLDFGNALLFSSRKLVDPSIDDLDEETFNAIYAFFASPPKFYTIGLYIQLETFVTNVQKEIAFMQAIGTSLMCVGGNLMMGIGGDGWEFGAGFQMIVQGLVLAIFGFLLSLAFAFYLIDAVVQLALSAP